MLASGVVHVVGSFDSGSETVICTVCVEFLSMTRLAGRWKTTVGTWERTGNVSPHSCFLVNMEMELGRTCLCKRAGCHTLAVTRPHVPKDACACGPSVATDLVNSLVRNLPASYRLPAWAQSTQRPYGRWSTEGAARQTYLFY